MKASCLLPMVSNTLGAGDFIDSDRTYVLAYTHVPTCEHRPGDVIASCVACFVCQRMTMAQDATRPDIISFTLTAKMTKVVFFYDGHAETYDETNDTQTRLNDDRWIDETKRRRLSNQHDDDDGNHDHDNRYCLMTAYRCCRWQCGCGVLVSITTLLPGQTVGLFQGARWV